MAAVVTACCPVAGLELELELELPLVGWLQQRRSGVVKLRGSSS